MSFVEAEPFTSSGRLTQKQIAQRLGVSRQLVGFALRGEGRMSSEVRQEILDVARESGYNQYSNQEARALVSRRYGKRTATGVLAVLFQPTFQNQPLSSVPFFMPFFEGLEREAHERGIDLTLCPLRPVDLPRFIREDQVDGVVCLLTPDGVAQRVSGLNLPVINILYTVRGTPGLTIDDRGGTRLATQHLVDLGHRRIAYLGVGGNLGDDGHIEKERLGGYCHGLAHNRLSYCPEIVDATLAEPTVKAGMIGMKHLLSRARLAVQTRAQRSGFTGVVCFNDMVAMGAIRVLEEAGLRVPEDVSVVGFDDVSEHYSFNPELTSVAFPREAIGRRAVQLLCEMREGALGTSQSACESGESTRQIFPVRLVERASTRRLDA